MASPQAENGYTKIANEILEIMAQSKFNGTQFRLLMIVWRYTYGFNRKEHELSVNFLVDATGISKRQIQKEVNNLIDAKVLIEVRPAYFNTTRIIAFNKDYDTWKIDTCTPKEQQVNEEGGGERLDTSTGERLDTSTGERLDTQERKVKESIKEIDNNYDDGQAQAWEFYYQNFGIASPFVVDDMNHYIDLFSDEIVIEALKRALKENKVKWSYAESILKKWKQRGVTSLIDIEGLDSEFNSQKRQRAGKATVRKENLPDWYGKQKEKEPQNKLPDEEIRAFYLECKSQGIELTAEEVEQLRSGSWTFEGLREKKQLEHDLKAL